MVYNCIIQFDNNKLGIFYAGQMLTGTISLKLDKVKEVKAIRLKIYGFAYTHWSTTTSTTSSNGSSSSSTTDYIGHEEYIKSSTFLLGTESYQAVKLEAGTHTFNFNCQIPATCPTSYECQYGHIRYMVKVKLKRSWKFDLSFTQGFTVIKRVDLNLDQAKMSLPACLEACKMYSGAPLILNVSTPQSGFVPGQVLPVSLLVTNESSIKVVELKVALVMLVSCYSQSPKDKRKERIVLLKLKGEQSVLRNSKKLFNYNLPIPATPPTCLNDCSIIKIVYQLEVKAKMGSLFSAAQEVCLPVVIGSVPLMSVLPKKQNMATYVAEKSEKHLEATESKDLTQTMPTSNAATNTTCINAPMATKYESAFYMKNSNLRGSKSQVYDDKHFVPLYPVFDIPGVLVPLQETSHAAYADEKKS